MIAADVNTGSLLGKVLLDIVGADRNGESTALGNSTARHAASSKSDNVPGKGLKCAVPVPCTVITTLIAPSRFGLHISW